jgi:hypothetical protein
MDATLPLNVPNDDEKRIQWVTDSKITNLVDTVKKTLSSIENKQLKQPVKNPLQKISIKPLKTACSWLISSLPPDE